MLQLSWYICSSHLIALCGPYGALLTCVPLRAATVGVITETNAEKAIEELKAYEVHFSTMADIINSLPWNMLA